MIKAAIFCRVSTPGQAEYLLRGFAVRAKPDIPYISFFTGSRNLNTSFRMVEGFITPSQADRCRRFDGFVMSDDLRITCVPWSIDEGGDSLVIGLRFSSDLRAPPLSSKYHHHLGVNHAHEDNEQYPGHGGKPYP